MSLSRKCLHVNKKCYFQGLRFFVIGSIVYIVDILRDFEKSIISTFSPVLEYKQEEAFCRSFCVSRAFGRK